MAGLGSELVSQYGPSGPGSVRFNKNYVKVVSEAGDVWEITYENVAQEVIQKHQAKIWFQLNLDETALQAIRPLDGTFLCRFGGFTRRGENEDAEPFDKKGGPREFTRPSGKVSKWIEPDRRKFTNILVIASGPFEGYSYIYSLDYLFTPAGSGMCKLQTTRAGWLDKLEKFLDVCGWNRETTAIPWSENVLPYLEQRLLDLAPDHTFLVSVVNGWPREIDFNYTGLS